MELLMKRVFLSVFFACVAVLLWACDMGAIEAKDLDDEMALLNYGEFNEDGMANLIPDAMAACNDDPQCVAAMEKAAGNGEVFLSSSEAQEEGTSSAADSSSKGGSSSSAQKGPVVPSSSSIQADTTSVVSSSSAATPVSSTTVVSSSSKSTTPIVNGICSPTPASVERGGSATWKYVAINSSVTIESYDWTFDEGSSITSSKDATPAVTYATKGSYGAVVVINKGLATEKEVKCQSKVEVTGIKVSGCTCTTPATSLVVSSSKSKEATWTVSGCTGAEPFTYAWGGGISGTEASGTMTISAKGSYAPTVTVTNSDGMTMSPTCNSVTASELPGASCRFGEHNYDANKSSMSVVPGQTFYFKAASATGITGTASMTLEGGGTTKTISVANGDNDAVQLTAPTTTGSYTYTLSMDGEEVCTAPLTVEYPTLTTTCSWGTPVMPGASVQFNMNKCSGWTDAMGDNATMVLTLDGKTTNLTVSRWNGYSGKITVPDELGTYSYTVTYGGKDVCTGSVTTAYPKITSTSCGFNFHSWENKYFFTAGSSFSNWDANVIGPNLSMDLYQDNEKLTTLSVNRYSNGDMYQLTFPTEPGTYTYRLDYQGNTVCSVEREVEE